MYPTYDVGQSLTPPGQSLPACAVEPTRYGYDPRGNAAPPPAFPDIGGSRSPPFEGVCWECDAAIRGLYIGRSVSFRRLWSRPRQSDHHDTARGLLAIPHQAKQAKQANPVKPVKMNRIDASEHYDESDFASQTPSLLTVIIDTNPRAWAAIRDLLPISKAIANILVFINAHLAYGNENQVAVLAAHT
ncbi:hypothetical protein CHU98_g10580, partial [Xylaria longipes]